MIGQAFEESRGKYDKPQRESFGLGESFSREMDYVKPEQNGRVGIEPEQTKNIGTELNNLHHSITKAGELFSILEDKIRPVRYPSPQCAEKDINPISVGSELRACLADQNMRLRALVTRIATMIDEIDL